MIVFHHQPDTYQQQKATGRGGRTTVTTKALRGNTRGVQCHSMTQNLPIQTTCRQTTVAVSTSDLAFVLNEGHFVYHDMSIASQVCLGIICKYVLPCNQSKVFFHHRTRALVRGNE